MKKILTLFLFSAPVIFFSCSTEKTALQKSSPFIIAQSHPGISMPDGNPEGLAQADEPVKALAEREIKKPVLPEVKKNSNAELGLSIRKENSRPEFPRVTATYRSYKSLNKKPEITLSDEDDGFDTNSFAIASFVVSLIGLFIFGVLLGILAIVLGIVALAMLAKSGKKGRGLAIAGIAIGVIDILAVLVLAALLL